MKEFKEFLKRLFEIYRPFKRVAVVLLVFLVIAQILALAQPYLFGKIIDMITVGKNFGSIFVVALIAFFFNVFSTSNHFFKGIFEVKNFDSDVVRFVSKTTMGKMMEFSIGQHRNENSGIKQSVMNGRVAECSPTYPQKTAFWAIEKLHFFA